MELCLSTTWKERAANGSVQRFDGGKEAAVLLLLRAKIFLKSGLARAHTCHAFPFPYYCNFGDRICDVQSDHSSCSTHPSINAGVAHLVDAKSIYDTTIYWQPMESISATVSESLW
jgi:hypothetical protein